MPELSHQAALTEGATVEVNITTSDALAGAPLSVLIMDDVADAADPATDHIVFIEQYELDDAGATDFQVQLPTEVLEDYDIVLNTDAGTDRYLAPLAGEEDPDDGGTVPDDDATPDPDDGQDDGGSDNGDSGAGSEEGHSGDEVEATDAADDSDSNAAGDESSEGFLASTGASTLFAALIAAAAIAIGVLLVLRRRRAS